MPELRFPLVGVPGNRDGSVDKDFWLKNCYVETNDEQHRFVRKRPGFTQLYDLADGEGRGIHEWKGDLYSVIGNTVYKNNVALTGNLNTSTGPVRFAENASGIEYLLIQDKTDLWTVATDDTLAEVTDVDLPSPMVSGIEVYDGYTFVLTPDARVYNSALADPLNWSALEFITAETRADGGVALIRYLDYLVVLGTETIEFFYDAANATGSPLLRYEGTSILIGCAAGDSVVKVESTFCFIGVSPGGGHGVYMYDGLTPKLVSTKAIDKILDAEGAAISDAYAFAIRYQGHSFYVVTLPTTGAITLVFDITENNWHEWSSFNGSVEGIFTASDSAVLSNVIYLLDKSSGQIYVWDADTYEDVANIIKVRGTTNKFDGDSKRNKILDRLEIVTDQTTSAGTFTLSWSDDDYKTFTTPVSLDLQSRAFLTRLGRFRRRAFRYTFESDNPIRLEAFELNLDISQYGE